jgi:hypothetical protein
MVVFERDLNHEGEGGVGGGGEGMTVAWAF